MKNPVKRRDPVKKNMDKFHKPRTHKDRTKYSRKNIEQREEFWSKS